MLNFFSPFLRRSQRRWLYPVLSVMIALGLTLGTAVRLQAIPLGDLIFQGIQLIQISNLSDDQEVAIGRQMNDELTRSEFRIFRDPALENYVTQIGQRLAARSDRPRIPYTFQIVADRDINAFATMGGFVYVTTGLMRAADNEAQLAGVISHEIGHIGGRHLVEQLKETAIQRGIATATGLNQSQAVGLGVELLLNRPNSRQAEFDADQRGFQTMGRAGYAQSAMIAFLEKLQSSGTPEFLSTHPNSANRVAALRSRLGRSGPKGDGLSGTAYKTKIRSLQ
ncbi:MAG: M48 family metallopeptidase [Leptolyngbyaceae cyanobacterium bins.59]|nr:M48 family metallopeptidase [Leptolyngbyaceae cyanobacterium bins.59]